MIAKAEKELGECPKLVGLRIGVKMMVRLGKRPVYIRDVPINLFGRCNDSDRPAEPSKYAGLGVPIEEMDKILKEEEDDAIAEVTVEKGGGT